MHILTSPCIYTCILHPLLVLQDCTALTHWVESTSLVLVADALLSSRSTPTAVQTYKVHTSALRDVCTEAFPPFSYTNAWWAPCAWVLHAILPLWQFSQLLLYFPHKPALFQPFPLNSLLSMWSPNRCHFFTRDQSHTADSGQFSAHWEPRSTPLQNASYLEDLERVRKG